jgi:dTDP-glucose 4,6-dehydratase
MQKILVTGGCGFIGSNFIRMVLRDTDFHVVNLDALTYAGNPANLAGLAANIRYSFVRGRIEDEAAVAAAMAGVDAVVHFAAESHVDRSIQDSRPFVTTNVLGTQTMLDAARRAGVEKFVHISTDEVYGTLGDSGIFTEETPLAPNSPYSASKAGADLLVRSYFETYKMPTATVRPSNNYGPYQFPEKFIPLMVTNLADGGRIPVYGDGRNIRDWLFVEDNCRAILTVLERAAPGSVYNVGGESEVRNIDVARKVLALVGLDESRMDFVTDRLGHDFRYALDNSKIGRELGWRPSVSFDEGIARTVGWYRDNRAWWERLKG